MDPSRIPHNGIAILGTSDIMTVVCDGNTIKSTHHKPFLANLINAGYTVIIITSRSHLGEQDHCWYNYVSPDNVYLPILNGEPREMGVEDKALIRAWREVFERFGLKPPIGDNALNWLKWRDAAKEQGVVVSSEQFPSG